MSSRSDVEKWYTSCENRIRTIQPEHEFFIKGTNDFSVLSTTWSHENHYQSQGWRRKKNTRISAEPHAIEMSVKHIFQRKKGRADIQKSRDDKEKSPFDDNGHIIEMQPHSS